MWKAGEPRRNINGSHRQEISSESQLAAALCDDLSIGVNRQDRCGFAQYGYVGIAKFNALDGQEGLAIAVKHIVRIGSLMIRRNHVSEAKQ
jgi:hypothetical protein